MSEWTMGGVPTTTEELLRHLPEMLAEEADSVQRARLERTLALVKHADRLWKAGMRWAEAQAEAARWFPPLTDEEIERTKETR